MATLAWQPTATIRNLQIRSRVLAKIRNFFSCRGIMEVETPLLSNHTNPDPFIESFEVLHRGKAYYLQTSPEFAMKRLLAAGSGPIYQLSKAFRAEEAGRQHNPEFTILEWYQPGFTHHELMTEMDDLLQVAIDTKPAERMTYHDVFQSYLSIDPHHVSVHELKQCASSHNIHYSHPADKDTWLNVLLTHCIEPHLGKEKPLFIYDYPPSQAALAKVYQNVAERFEVYFKGMELANGFHELSDAVEQEKRFTLQIETRRQQKMLAPPLDRFLLDALHHGLPNCAGVALGIDRLVMLACGAQHIRDVMGFVIENA